jgi:LDH2 family malate/lactate/ureidoglycolate dehydrogenase
MVNYPYEKLEAFCVAVMQKYGVDEARAKVMAESLLFADSRRVSSHGIVRLPLYMSKVDNGIMNIKTEMPFIRESGATALLDAQNGLGQLAGHKGMMKAIELAKKYGIGMVGVRDSNHFGTGAWYSMLAADQGMIGIAMANASPAIAPFGSTVPFLGTNPLSIAVPAGKNHKPIVLDMAMSPVARGKIRIYEKKGEKIPLDWGLDVNGKPTDDPKEALKGSLVAIGGVKGSALSLIVDLISGVMTSTGLTGETKGITDTSGPSQTGHAFIVVDISRFIDTNEFGENVDKVIDTIKALPRKPGFNEIFMAGEIEYGLMEKVKVDGIGLEDPVVKELNELAEKLGVEKL